MRRGQRRQPAGRPLVERAEAAPNLLLGERSRQGSALARRGQVGSVRQGGDRVQRTELLPVGLGHVRHLGGAQRGHGLGVHALLDQLLRPDQVLARDVVGVDGSLQLHGLGTGQLVLGEREPLAGALRLAWLLQLDRPTEHPRLAFSAALHPLLAAAVDTHGEVAGFALAGAAEEDLG